MEFQDYANAVNSQIAEHYKNELGDEAANLNYSDVAGVTKLQFSNKQLYIPLEKYEQNHNSEGWVLRKFTAIPKAIYSGVIKSVAHLIKGSLLAILGDSEGGKASLFSSARDL